MSTLVLDTIQDRVSGASVTAKGVTNVWESVAEMSPSADSTLTIHHDGIDGTAVDFVDGYDYRVEIFGLYGSSNAASLSLQLWEAGSARDDTDCYLKGFAGAEDGSAITQDMLFSTTAYFGGAQWGTGTNNSTDFMMDFYNLGSTSRASTWEGWGSGLNNTVGSAYRVFGRTYGLGTPNVSHLLAAEKIVLTPSAGTVTATLARLLRRKIT
jgi:hypothetical protein